MVQKSLGPKKFRRKGGDSDSDDSDGAPKGATSVVHKSKGANIEKTDQNATAVRNFDLEEDKDQRAINDKKEQIHEETKGKEDDKIYSLQGHEHLREEAAHQAHQSPGRH